TQGQDKRTTARFLAFGVNGLSVALMIVVFSYSYGLSGAEVGIAGGSAVLGQKLLEAVFGDQAVRSLAERSRQALEVRVRTLLDAERARYLDLLDGLQLEAETPDQLRDASRRVDDLRFAAQQEDDNG
ncbi:MAG TPA: ABC transporter, partial [Nocardioides sp.]|nr:ABC transporter [Nocardioides sp.]